MGGEDGSPKRKLGRTILISEEDGCKEKRVRMRGFACEAGVRPEVSLSEDDGVVWDVLRTSKAKEQANQPDDKENECPRVVLLCPASP